MTRVLVFGGRYYFDSDRMNQVLDAAVERLGLTEVIHGDASGADKLAKEWAAALGVFHTEFEANWSDLSHPDARIKNSQSGKSYDAAAGPRRNQRMIEEGRPNYAIAFPGDRGTRDMVSRCRAAKIQCFLIDWKG